MLASAWRIITKLLPACKRDLISSLYLSNNRADFRTPMTRTPELVKSSRSSMSTTLRCTLVMPASIDLVWPTASRTTSVIRRRLPKKSNQRPNVPDVRTAAPIVFMTSDQTVPRSVAYLFATKTIAALAMTVAKNTTKGVSDGLASQLTYVEHLLRFPSRPECGALMG